MQQAVERIDAAAETECRLIDDGLPVVVANRGALDAEITAWTVRHDVAELERLLKAGGVPPHLAHGGRIPTLPQVHAAPGAAPEAVAAQVARAVYGAMGGRANGGA